MVYSGTLAVVCVMQAPEEPTRQNERNDKKSRSREAKNGFTRSARSALPLPLLTLPLSTQSALAQTCR